MNERTNERTNEYMWLCSPLPKAEIFHTFKNAGGLQRREQNITKKSYCVGTGMAGNTQRCTKMYRLCSRNRHRRHKLTIRGIDQILMIYVRVCIDWGVTALSVRCCVTLLTGVERSK